MIHEIKEILLAFTENWIVIIGFGIIGLIRGLWKIREKSEREKLFSGGKRMKKPKNINVYILEWDDGSQTEYSYEDMQHLYGDDFEQDKELQYKVKEVMSDQSA